MYLLVHVYMLHPATFRAFFFNIVFNVYIKIWLPLQYNIKFQNKFFFFEGKQNNLYQRAQTSVAGSNIFFNSRHSLGFPMGSVTANGITVAGRIGAETAA